MPRLELSDPRWHELLGGYRTPEDFPTLLQALQENPEDTSELWEVLHHQGDVDSGSYASLPYLLDAAEAQERDIRVYTLGLVGTILALSQAEHNPKPPADFAEQLTESRQRLGQITLETLAGISPCDEPTFALLLGALSVSRNLDALGNVLLDWQGEWACPECGSTFAPEGYEL